MKRIKNAINCISALCVMFVFSCQQELLIDLTEKPDKQIENIHGTLYYHKDLKGWIIRHPVPETHDAIDNYLIAEMHDKKFSFKEGKQVVLGGYCYHIPRNKLADKGVYYPAGIEFYYIIVNYLK